MDPESKDSSTAAKAAPANDQYPVTLNIDYPASQSRLLAFFSIPFFLIRIVLLIPHFIAIYFLQIVALILVWLNFWVVLFSGHSSQGMHRFAVGTLRWSTRLSAYMYGLTDDYPPFKLDN